MIRPEKMTVKTQEAIAAAQELASARSAASIEPEHLLLALLDQEGGFVPELLKKVGTNLSQLRTQVDAQLKKLPQVSGGGLQLSISQTLHRVLEQAQKEADAMKDSFVSTEHLLLALLQERGIPSARILADNGVTREGL